MENPEKRAKFVRCATAPVALNTVFHPGALVAPIVEAKAKCFQRNHPYVKGAMGEVESVAPSARGEV